MNSKIIRYGIIDEKDSREIVLLQGRGCFWKKCSFCDYHTDFSLSENRSYTINKSALSNVTGKYKKLEIVNSGSFTELDDKTIDLILETSLSKNITTLYFESHYLLKSHIPSFKNKFLNRGIKVIMKCGVETFDVKYRDDILKKGMNYASPDEISNYFDQACLLFGLKGQTVSSMKEDIDIGLKFFSRLCINIMQKNTTSIIPDHEVIQKFLSDIYPNIKNNPRIDILLNNTDFQIGGTKYE